MLIESKIVASFGVNPNGAFELRHLDPSNPQEGVRVSGGRGFVVNSDLTSSMVFKDLPQGIEPGVHENFLGLRYVSKLGFPCTHYAIDVISENGTLDIKESRKPDVKLPIPIAPSRTRTIDQRPIQLPSKINELAA